MPLDKSCNALAFCPKVFSTYFLFLIIVQWKRTHTQTHTHMKGESQVFVVPIVPSRRMPWQSAKGALFWELEAVLFWDEYIGKFWEECSKKSVQCSRLGVSIQRRCICMAKSTNVHKPFKVRRCSFRGGAQSNKFYCTLVLFLFTWFLRVTE